MFRDIILILVFKGDRKMFCSKCGAKLFNGDVFCRICGASTEITDEPAEVVSEATAVAEAPSLTTEESIALADKLFDLYKNLERAEGDLKSGQEVLKKPVDTTYRPHARFKFFWPFLIYAVIAVYAFYFLALLSAKANAYVALFMLAMVGISPIALLIYGGVRANRLATEANEESYRRTLEIKRHREEKEKEVATLKLKVNKTKDSIKCYSHYVPINLRNSGSMRKAKALLSAGKASNFSEAMELIGKK